MNYDNKRLFITVDGGEGSGKTTLCHSLVELLEETRIPAVYVTELGSFRPTIEIRTIALSEKTPVNPLAQTLLIAAARAETYAYIRQYLSDGVSVVCDRSPISSLVYQGRVLGVPRETVVAINDHATGGLRPDVCLIVDCDVREALRRRRSRAADSDVFESRPESFHSAVRQGFLDEAALHRAVIVDGGGEPADVAADAFVAIKNRFDRHARAR